LLDIYYITLYNKYRVITNTEGAQTWQSICRQ
jgi:hypothetical protein